MKKLLLAFTFIVLLGAGCASTPTAPKLVTVHESASTNSPGNDFTIFSDGSAEFKADNGSKGRTLPPGTVDVKTLGDLLKEVGDVSELKTGGGCMHSASFGTSTTIIYDGKTSGDLQCRGESWPTGGNELADLLLKIRREL